MELLSPQQPPSLGFPPAKPAAPPASPSQAPKPSASPSKDTTAAPANKPESSSQDADNEDPFAALDAKAMARKKTEDKTPQTDDQPGAELTGDKSDRMIGESKNVKKLRVELNARVAELKAKSDSFASMETKMKDLEARGKDVTALSEQLAAKEKALQEAHAELRAVKQEADPEFKKQWDKPFLSATRHAIEAIKQLNVTNTEDGTVRYGTYEDLNHLYNLPYNKAIQQAKDMFGDGTSVVLQHITKLHELDFNRREALEEEKSHAGERQQAEQAKQAAENEMTQSMWITVNKGVAEAHPELFQPVPNDPEGNELLAEGFKIADTFFTNRRSLSKQQLLILDANVRHRVAAFSREIHRNGKLTDEVAALKAQIEEMKKSEPGQTKRTGTDQVSHEQSFEDELRAVSQ